MKPYKQIEFNHTEYWQDLADQSLRQLSDSLRSNMKMNQDHIYNMYRDLIKQEIKNENKSKH